MLPIFSFGQTTFLEGDFEDAFLDANGNIFTLTPNQVLARHGTKETGPLYTFNENTYGKIARVDLSNPLKPLLFYRDAGKICLLDNTLSLQGGPIDLFGYDFDFISVACASDNNNLWLYDQGEKSLIRTSRNMERIQTIRNLPMLLQVDFEPIFMTEVDDALYVLDSKNGIFVFDLFGGLMKKIALSDVNQISVFDGLIFFDKDGLKQYKVSDFETVVVKIPFENCQNIKRFERGWVCVQAGKVAVKIVER